MITIVDYDAGNLGSIVNMLKKVGAGSVLASAPEEIEAARKLILPGVGAFDSGIGKLKERGLIEVLHKKVLKDRIPILGICLGMQLMTKKSEEGTENGLGWINADTLAFKSLTGNLKIPHMGWNEANLCKESKLMNNKEEQRFYFVHSYFVKCHNPEDVLLTSSYGISFHSGFEKDNILGVQFHPEKSHKFGMELIKNFVYSY